MADESVLPASNVRAHLIARGLLKPGRGVERDELTPPSRVAGTTLPLLGTPEEAQAIRWPTARERKAAR